MEIDSSHPESSPPSRKPARATIPGSVVVFVFIALASTALIVALPEIFSGRTDLDGKRMGTKVMLLNLNLQLDSFQRELGRYPTAAEGLDALVHAPPTLPQWKHRFMETLPMDNWGQPFMYRSPGTNAASYDLYSIGPDGIDGTADDIHVDSIK